MEQAPLLHLLPHGVTLLCQLLQGRVKGRADAVVPRTYVCVCVYVCMHACTHVCMHGCMCVCVYIYMSLHTTHIHTDEYILIHTIIHTNTY